MSQWNIAAAQYARQHHRVDEHVEHHLRFIAEAARQQCNLLVFPELSLTGPASQPYPPRPAINKSSLWFMLRSFTILP
jgi:predicted amidohydrolase